jgi:hypothetical protein
MSSSTSAFEKSAIAAFAGAFVMLMAPYEFCVRAAEQRYGERRASIAMPRTLSPKVDEFLFEYRNGIRFAAYATGTSRVEASVCPDLLDGTLGRTYNAALGGSSSIATLELFERLGLYPQVLVVGVSPMDFTRLGVQRGEKGIARAQRAAVSESVGFMADRSRAVFYAALHSARPDRRRNLGQWLEWWRGNGELLAFLNNEDAVGPPLPESTRGYVASDRVAPPEAVREGTWSNIPGEYREAHRELMARIAALVRRFQQRGTTVIFVRVPTAAGVRRSEDSETTFASDIATLSGQLGVRYIDGSRLVSADFAGDHRNFTDSEHLNSTGAQQFSRALSEALRR